jgi:adenosylcobinamide-GDP ribazoletransferase
LKDSRVGTYGACAVVLSIAGRAALVAQLGDHAAWALPLVGAAARVGPVWQIATLPYVTSEHSRSRSIVGAGHVQAWMATGWAIAVGAGMSAAHLVPTVRVMAVAAACATVTAACSWRYKRRMGGITGDFLGATEQLCELAALMALAWGL